MPGSDHKSNPIQRRQSQRTKKQAQITNMPHPPSTKTKKQSVCENKVSDMKNSKCAKRSGEYRDILLKL